MKKIIYVLFLLCWFPGCSVLAGEVQIAPTLSTCIDDACKQFKVTWTVVTVEMASCPLDEQRRTEAAKYGMSGYSNVSCAVLHTKTSYRVLTKMFETEDAAEEFIAFMPICKEFLGLGECIRDVKRSWMSDKEQLEAEAAEQAFIDSVEGRGK